MSLESVGQDFAGNGLAGALQYQASSGQSYSALSDGSGSFAYVGEPFSAGLNILRSGYFWGPYKADLALYRTSDGLGYIGEGNGNGTFNFQSLFWSAGYDYVECADMNGDGLTDVALYNSSTGTMYTGI